MVAVVDFGMGNLDSVMRALSNCGGAPVLVRDPEAIAGASALVLPGVGAFAEGMARMRERGLDEAVSGAARDGMPLLGLCLGMQLLTTRGGEGGESSGLGLVPGEVLRLEPAEGLRVPHIGWNDVHATPESSLFFGVPPGTDFYFVHSYHVVCDEESDVVARIDYGRPLVAAFARGYIHGVQFHPEKSQRAGFHLLRNFVALANGARSAAPALESSGH